MANNKYPSFEVSASERFPGDKSLLVTVMVTESGELPCLSIFSKNRWPCDITTGRGNYITQFTVRKPEEIEPILQDIDKAVKKFVDNPTNVHATIDTIKRTIQPTAAKPKS